MPRFSRRALLALVCLLVPAGGCQSPEAPVPVPSAPATAVAPSSAEAPTSEPASEPASERARGGGTGSGRGDGSGKTTAPSGGGGSGNATGGGGGQRKFRQANVYVDGTPVAVVKFGELPPGLKSTWVTRPTSEGDASTVRRFLLADYFAALGVDVKRIQAVHFYGGRARVGIMTGAELLKQRKDVLFSFTQGETGKPRLHWPKEIELNDKIDMMNDVTVYVDKPAPTWNKETWRLEIGGQAVEGIPYATVEPGGGTRLYVDGRLARTIRPATLPPAAGDPPRWSLAAQLAGAGVVLNSVTAVDLVERDVLVKRLDRKIVAAATFDAPEQGQGRITVHPGELQAEAILVYVKARPADPAAPRVPAVPAAGKPK